MSVAPLVIIVNSSLFSVKNIQELIAYAKARPGKLSYGSSGNGSSPHLAMELFKMQTGIDMVHVPYKGSPQVVTDLVAGHVVGEIAFMPVSVFEIDRGNVVAKHADRVKHTVVPACQIFLMACHRAVPDGIGCHCNKF